MRIQKTDKSIINLLSLMLLKLSIDDTALLRDGMTAYAVHLKIDIYGGKHALP